MKTKYSSHRIHLEKLWAAYLDEKTFPQFDKWIDGQFRRHKEFGKRDRQHYADWLFAALRFAKLALAVRPGNSFDIDESATPVANALRELDPQWFWSVIAYRIGTPSESELDTRTLAALAAIRDNSALAARLIWSGLPLAWQEPIIERAKISGWGDEQVRNFIAMQAERSPLWLRVRRADLLPAVKAEVRANEVDILHESELALCVSAARRLTQLTGYTSGSFEIQDWSSQQIGTAMRPEPDWIIWDACAGGGGKSAQLASYLGERGFLYASDLRSFKLAEVARRLARAGATRFKTFTWRGEQLTDAELRELRCDLVLVDAPCSSSGVARRNPEIRLKVNAQTAADLAPLQLRLLGHASRAVKPGGYLVYGTCSFFAAENEQVVEKFADQSPEFQIETQGVHGAPERNSDTTFKAVLRREG